ncbi:hypothetical protein SNE40_007945 [Patella caerulea]|uniref:Transmembrane protein n=1 Tax=Patella caerulea TaxID=87958 RepID=A0AAN8JUR3_PATCE
MADRMSEEGFRRRVQHRLAGRLLDTIDPDRLYAETQPEESKFSSIKPETRKQFEETFGKYQKKESAFSIQNILWLIASIAVFHYSDFYMVLRFNPNINRLWFNIGAILIAINVCVAIFLIGWLTYIKKVNSDQWEKQYPAAIPIATGCFVCGAICVNVGLWPVWGPLTPVILFTILMGIVVIIVMLG